MVDDDLFLIYSQNQNQNRYKKLTTYKHQTLMKSKDKMSLKSFDAF